MDFYKITTEGFVSYFVQQLRSEMKLTQINYSDEFLDPHDEIDTHIIKCQKKLSDYIVQNINSTGLTEDDISELYDRKRKEVFPLLDQYIEKYIEEVQVDYVDVDEPRPTTN